MRLKLVIFAVMIIVGIALFMFRGWQDYGMQYDEVFRLNQYVQYFEPEARPWNQTIYSLKIGSLSVPLMQKQYISTLGVIHQVPALFFDDFAFWLRILHLAYFSLAAIVLYLFVKKSGNTVALLAAVLFLVNPLYYSEVRYGFVQMIHVILFLGAAILARKYYQKPALWPWLIVGLLIGLAVNIHLYSLWTLIGAGLSALMVLPRHTGRFLKNWRRVLIIFIGFVAGSINFWIYNLANRGATFRPFVEGLLSRDTFNQHTIDFAKESSLKDELLNKVSGFFDQVFYSAPATLIATLAVLLCGTFIVLLFISRVWKRRYLLFAPVALITTWFLVFVTPASDRSGHWSFISPFFELSIVSFLIAARSLVAVAPRLSFKKSVAFSSAVIVLAIFFVSSNQKVIQANATHGERDFSPGIYELFDTLNTDTTWSNAVAVDWGLASQLYFLSHGRLDIYEISFRLVNKPSEEAYREIETAILTWHEEGKNIWFLYHSYDRLSGNREKFRTFAEQYGLSTKVVWEYQDQDGAKHFAVILPDEEKLVELLCKKVENNKFKSCNAVK